MNKAKRLPIALEKAGHKIALAISEGEERSYHQGQIDALDWVTEIFWGDPDEWEDEEDENSFEESELFLKEEAQKCKNKT